MYQCSNYNYKYRQIDWTTNNNCLISHYNYKYRHIDWTTNDNCLISNHNYKYRQIDWTTNDNCLISNYNYKYRQIDWTTNYNFILLTRTVSIIIAGLIVLIGVSHAFYGPGDDVVELEPSNFDQQVMQSDELWLVEFYAPWWVF